MLKKVLLSSSVFLLSALLGGAGYLSYRLYTSLAPLDGKIKISGLKSPVRVLRDKYGIPHIYAENHRDGLRALGFTVASERLLQMELTRRLVYGELAEVFGEPALASDKLFRSLMLKKAIQRMLDLEKKEGRFNQEIWDDMTSYFEGVNEYMRIRPRSFELQLVGIRPRPFEPLDAYMMTGYMAFGFAVPLKLTPILTKLTETLSAEKMNELRNATDAGQKVYSKTKTPAEMQSWRELEAIFDRFALPQFEGSNAWLLSGKRSASGKSLFANDPHIAFSNPAVWIEVHLKTPRQEIYGHYLPLVPFPILGHTPHSAWGFTMSLTDDMDYFREKLDHSKKTALYKNEPYPYETWNESIKVKNQSDIELELIETAHGPLMDAVLTEKNLSLSWAYLSPRNNPLKALWGMGHAKSMQEFENSLKETTAPGLNVMYADANNIAWWMTGQIAKHRKPHSDLILDGASGEDEILGYLNWDEKPHQVNPAEGFIVTANSHPRGLDKTFRGDWQSDNRYQTIVQALKQKEIWTVKDTQALQTLSFGQQTPLFVQKMISCLVLNETEQKQAQATLSNLQKWNHKSTVESTAASFYHLWNNYNLQNFLADLDEEAREVYLNSSYAWMFYERQILQYDCKKDPSIAEKITAGFKSTLQDPNSQKQWGQIHTVEYVHPLGRLKPLNYIYNIGPYPAPGAYNEINNIKFKTFGTSFPANAGPSTRRIVDMSDTRLSWGINPIGVSGHLLSPYRTLEVQKYLKGEYREQWMDLELIQKNKTHELSIIPSQN